MKIFDSNVDLDDLFNLKYMHKEIKKGFFLSDYQLEVLSKYNININDVGSINELIYEIDIILEEEEYEDLAQIANEIQEFNYYLNTNK